MTEKELTLLASIFDAMVDGVYIIKNDYTIEFMNKAMIKELEDGTGKKCYQCISHLDEVCPWCKAREEEYERLFEHVGCGVFISSKEGRFLDANQAFSIC